ncbi:uncharacterized protein ZBAI_03165 [Zygosaccharomyces bailii ISA1307]|nr:uncharacterized protein ZBAI_03165 [Zygosaccharomyces bailii ISA1307]
MKKIGQVRIRTEDLPHAKGARYQLRHMPTPDVVYSEADAYIPGGDGLVTADYPRKICEICAGTKSERTPRRQPGNSAGFFEIGSWQTELCSLVAWKSRVSGSVTST